MSGNWEKSSRDRSLLCSLPTSTHPCPPPCLTPSGLSIAFIIGYHFFLFSRGWFFFLNKVFLFFVFCFFHSNYNLIPQPLPFLFFFWREGERECVIQSWRSVQKTALRSPGCTALRLTFSAPHIGSGSGMRVRGHGSMCPRWFRLEDPRPEDAALLVMGDN